MSPLSSPNAKIPDAKAETTSNNQCPSMLQPDTSNGKWVCILNSDLSSGTVVTLPQSPISDELEAAKSLLSLKAEGNIGKQYTEDPVMDQQPVCKDISNEQSPSLKSTTDVNTEKYKECEESENSDNPAPSKPVRAVETALVEMSTSSEPNEQDHLPPGGVVISPLPE